MTTPAQPLVTFALFAYNQERFIREAVDGALSQSYSPLEVVLSDDCSTDRTFDIIRDLAATYTGPHRIIINRNDTNLGLGAHINKVVSISHGEILVMAAGDDVSLPNRVERIAGFLQSKGKDVFSVYSDADQIAESGESMWRVGYPLSGDMSHAARFVRKGLRGVPGFTQACRRAVFERFGPLHDKLIHEDSVIPFRALLLGRIARIEEVLVRYRLNPTSIMRTAGWGTREGLSAWHQRSTVTFVNCIADATRLDETDFKGQDAVMRELLRRLCYHTASQCLARSIPRFCAVQARWLPIFGREALLYAGSALKIAMREAFWRGSAPHIGGSNCASR
jgi:glycosyltransferase involved in cell wall biosynthesis